MSKENFLDPAISDSIDKADNGILLYFHGENIDSDKPIIPQLISSKLITKNINAKTALIIITNILDAMLEKKSDEFKVDVINTIGKAIFGSNDIKVTGKFAIIEETSDDVVGFLEKIREKLRDDSVPETEKLDIIKIGLDKVKKLLNL